MASLNDTAPGFPQGGSGPNDPTAWKCAGDFGLRLKSDNKTFECATPATNYPMCPAGCSNNTYAFNPLFPITVPSTQNLSSYTSQLTGWSTTEAVCGPNPTGQNCKTYLFTASSNPYHPREEAALLKYCMVNFGSCDDFMKSYCANNPTDAKCSCIKSPLVNYQYNPLCTDQGCIQTGYQTTSMMSARGSGCQIVDCNTYYNISAQGNVKIADNTISQRCGSSSAASSQTSSSSSTSSITNVLSTNSKYIYIGLAVLAIGGVLAFFFLKKKKSK